MAIAPIRIKLDVGSGTLGIRWSDGHESRYDYQYLRRECPCATCTGREGAQPVAAAPLPMFQAALRPERAELVGRYAVQIFWSDGHSTGIYTFSYLRGLCACAECASRREP